MILHTREEWLNVRWIGGSPAFDPVYVEHMTCHYMGGNNIDCSESIRLLNTMQSDYARNRGYDLGYSYAVDRMGVAWEIRGMRSRAASDGSTDTNRKTVSCLFMLPDMTDDLNPLMVQAYRDLMDLVRRTSPRAQHWIGHRDVFPTTCCGAVVYNKYVQTGLLEPVVNPNPPGYTPFPPEEDDVSMKNPFVKLQNKFAIWHSNGVQRSWIQSPLNLRQQLFESGRIDDAGYKNLSDEQLREPPYVTIVGDLGGYGAVVGPDPGDV